MWILSPFTENGMPALGLFPTIRIRDISDGSLVVIDDPMIEKGDGFYAYDFAGYDDTKDYAVRCDSVTLSGTDRYSYASSGEYNYELNLIESAIDGVDTRTQGIESTVGDINTRTQDIESIINDVDVRTTLLRKIQTNRLELADGNISNWILYDDDNISPLLTFTVTDKNGALIIQQPNIPSKRSKGV